jgi:serine/threonine protein kinase
MRDMLSGRTPNTLERYAPINYYNI